MTQGLSSGNVQLRLPSANIYIQVSGSGPIKINFWTKTTFGLNFWV
jgi:hypothetical protein